MSVVTASLARSKTLPNLLGEGAPLTAVFTGVLFVAASLFVDGFATVSNIQALLLSVSLVGIIAVGLSLVTLVGRIFSLSIAATVAVSTVSFAATLEYGAWTALLVVAVIGAVIGLAQGVLVGWLRTDPILTTIAVGAIVAAIGQSVTGGRNVRGHGDASIFNGQLFGFVPFQVFTFVLFAAVLWWVHRKTELGRLMSLVGLSERAIQVSGVRVAAVVAASFMISGTLAGIAGGLLAAESGQGTLQLGARFGFDAIVAVVVGGVSVKGGHGGPLGAAGGAVLIGLIGNALILMGIDYEYQLVLQGVIVLTAVIVSGTAAHRTSARKA